jgi:hypothetical protein
MAGRAVQAMAASMRPLAPIFVLPLAVMSIALSAVRFAPPFQLAYASMDSPLGHTVARTAAPFSAAVHEPCPCLSNLFLTKQPTPALNVHPLHADSDSHIAWSDEKRWNIMMDCKEL